MAEASLRERPVPAPARGETATSDPFLQRFFARIPAEVAGSFTAPQLDAVKLAFGARDWGEHAIDVRRAIGAGRWRFYVVLLMGRTRRNADGRGPRLLAAAADALDALGRRLRRTSLIVLIGILVLAAMLGAFAVLYAGKRALNINVVPGVDMLPDKQIEAIIR